MLRSLFKRSRTIRVPVDHGGVQVQQVKLVRTAASKSSNFITTFFIAYFVFRFLESRDPFGIDDKGKTVGEDLDKWKKEHDRGESRKSLGEHWEKQHAELKEGRPRSGAAVDGNIRQTSEVMQITIPVWMRAKQQPLYQPSDPEYKEYVRLQSDKKRMDDLKRTVGKWAGARLSNPAHEVNLAAIGFNGKIGLTLDIVPQLYPPPLYEVPCIGIEDGKAFFGWRTLSNQLGARMDQIFRPQVTLAATKAAFTTFFSASYAITTAKLMELFVPQSETAKIRASFEKALKPLPTTPKAVLSEKDIAKDNAIPSAANWPADKKAVQELLRAVHDGKLARARHQDIVKAIPYSTAVQLAAATFKRTQIMGHAALKQLSTRGVLQIRGLVTCFGDRGQYRMEVIAFYQPGEDAFLGPIKVQHAYVMMNFGKWQEWEESKQKDIHHASKAGQLAAASKADPAPSSSENDKP